MLWQMIRLVNNPLLLLLFIVFTIVPLLFSIAFHELAHGYVAYKFGDITPKAMGRLTLNPLKHLDLLGTILLITVGLGWAKPIIINPNNIPTSTKQMLVALAGPSSNFLLALIFACIISFLENYCDITYNNFIIMFFNVVVTINIALGVFNLVPLPPLDGSRIVAWLLPIKLKEQYYKLEKYGMFIMLLLLFTIGFSGIFVFANIIQKYLYQILKVAI